MTKIENPTRESWSALLKRPTANYNSIEETVKLIFSEVQSKGDVAVTKYSSFFDGITLTDLIVSEEEIKEAKKIVTTALKQAIQSAKENIEKFHAAQKTPKTEIETTAGVLCWQEKELLKKSVFTFLVVQPRYFQLC